MTNFCIIPHLQVLFNKGAHYSFIVLFVCGSQNPPQNLFSNITYSWTRHAVCDNKNVKKAGRQQHINARL